MNYKQDAVNPGMIFTWFICNNSANGVWLSRLLISPCLRRDQMYSIFFSMPEEAKKGLGQSYPISEEKSGYQNRALPYPRPTHLILLIRKSPANQA